MHYSRREQHCEHLPQPMCDSRKGQQELILDLLLFLLLQPQSGANAIYYAARHGHVDTLKFLHGKMCPLDIQDKVNDDFLAPPLSLLPPVRWSTASQRATHTLLAQRCPWGSAPLRFTHTRRRTWAGDQQWLSFYQLTYLLL